MVGITASPKQFAQRFNVKVPGAWRQLTVADVLELTELGLIKRHNYYSSSADMETVRAILAYEEWRQRQKEPTQISDAPRLCKSCGQPVPLEVRKGRPREYCPTCESSRAAERHRRWRARKRKQKPITEMRPVYD